MISRRCAGKWFVLAVLSLLAACGTSSVQMVVVQPAVLNARPYGGSVSVAGFEAAHPDLIEVAGQVRHELQQQVLRSVGGVVALREYGGGLVVSGQVADYSMRMTEAERKDTCEDEIEAEQSGVKTKTKVKRQCLARWYDWRARVVVLMRVTTAQGVALYIRNHVAERSGSTAEQVDSAPNPPDAHGILRGLRAQVVDEMGLVLAPQRVRVTATFYDCEEPAEAVCEAGVKHLAQSRYNEAAAAFTEAIQRLAHATREDLAHAHWNRGVVYQYARRFDEAIADLRRANELDPSDAYRQGLRSVEAARARHGQLIQQGLGQ